MQFGFAGELFGHGASGAHGIITDVGIESGLGDVPAHGFEAVTGVFEAGDHPFGAAPRFLSFVEHLEDEHHQEREDGHRDHQFDQ